MTDIQIEIRSTDYEKTAEGLYPKLLERCAKKEQPGLMERFLLKMGASGGEMVCGFLSSMPDEEKAELICSLTGEYNQKILELLNGFLQKNEAGRFIRIGRISAVPGQKGSILLRAGDIDIDYRGLVKCRLFRDKTAQLAEQYAGIFKEICSAFVLGTSRFLAGSFSRETEKVLIRILQKKESRKRILAMIQQALQERKIWMELADYTVIRSAEKEESVCWDVQEYAVTDEILEKLLDAAVQYLKSLLK